MKANIQHRYHIDPWMAAALLLLSCGPLLIPLVYIVMNKNAAHSSYSGIVIIAVVGVAGVLACVSVRVFRGTKLHYCARTGQESSARTLVDSQSNVNATTIFGDTPLHLAVKYEHIGVVMVLVDAHANCDAANRVGQSPLHEAAINGNLTICQILLNGGAIPFRQDKWGRTPAQLARLKGHEALAGLIEKVAVNMQYRTERA
jgi:hypothetical protein